MIAMIVRSKFICRMCSAEVICDAPDSDAWFAEKVPCTSCSNVGCTYWGPA